MSFVNDKNILQTKYTHTIKVISRSYYNYLITRYNYLAYYHILKHIYIFHSPTPQSFPIFLPPSFMTPDAVLAARFCSSSFCLWAFLSSLCLLATSALLDPKIARLNQCLMTWKFSLEDFSCSIHLWPRLSILWQCTKFYFTCTKLSHLHGTSSL